MRTRSRSRSAMVLLVAASAMVLQLAGPALAVGAFGPAYRVVPLRCNSIWTTVAADGISRGFAGGCSDGHPVLNVAGSGSRWRYSYSPWNAHLLAAASDGKTTFALLVEKNGTYLRYRNSAGTYGPGQRLSAKQAESGDVVAVNGKWWVVWTEIGASGGMDIREAHTLGGTQASRIVVASDQSTHWERWPALAWRASTAEVVMVWTHSLTSSQVSIRLMTSKGRTWTAPRVVDAVGFYPNVVATGSTIAVAFAGGAGCPCPVTTYTGTPTGPLTKHVAKAKGWIAQPQLSYSEGRLHVGWTERIDSEHYRVHVAERNGTTWSEAPQSTPAYPSVVDLDSFRGRARLMIIQDQKAVTVRSQ